MPYFLILVVMFLLWFTYERKKADKQSQYSSEKFWEREKSAVYVPRQSTDDIAYITIPDEVIPAVDENSSPELREARRDLIALSKKPIANLSAYSNTDLKLKYGTGNYQQLALADGCYIKLVQLVIKTAGCLISGNRNDDALRILEFGFNVGMDNSRFLLMLGKLYSEQGSFDKIEALIARAQESSLTSDSTIAQLKSYSDRSLDSILDSVPKSY